MNKIRNIVLSLKAKKNEMTVLNDNNSSNSLTRINLGEYYKNLELETRLKKCVEYIISVNEFDQFTIDDVFIKKLQKINEEIKNRDKLQAHLFSMLNYVKVIECLINLLKLTQDCSKCAVIEFNGRRQDKNLKLHQDHFLVVCVRANKIYREVIALIASLTDMSSVFRKLFDEKGGTPIILDYYDEKNDFLIDCFRIPETSNHYSTSEIIELMENKLVILRNLNRSNSFSNNKELIIKKLKAIINASSKNHSFKLRNEYVLVIYSILSKLTRDNEIDGLVDIVSTVKKLVDMINVVVNVLEAGEKATRVSFDLNDDIKKTNVCKVPKCGFNFNIIDLLNMFYYLNKNDRIRYDIFMKSNLTELFNRIILSGNDVEAEYSILLLLQFALDERLGPTIAKDNQLVAIINKILIYQYPNEKLNKYCQALIWIIEKKYTFENSNDFSRNSMMENSLHKTQRVMISYDASLRNEAIIMETELKKEDLKVWLKDEKVDEYNFEKQMLALENSDCVLLRK